MATAAQTRSACPCGGIELGPAVYSTAFRGHAYELRPCLRCRRLLLDPPPSADELAAAYDPSYYGAGSSKFVGPIEAGIEWFRRSRSRAARRLVEAGPKPEGRAPRVLDIGCGNGRFLAHLAEAGFECHGTELSAETARRAMGLTGIQVRVGELEADSYPAASFELVSIWHVLEHLPDPERTLHHCARWLVPGGALMLAVPNVASWQARIFRGAWFHLDPPRHLFHFTPASLSDALDAAGFRWTSVAHLSWEQNLYGYLQSLVNAMGFPRDELYEVLKRTRPFAATRRLAVQVLVLTLLALPAILMTLLEATCGRGGTIQVTARRER
jgi:SAM-dependent methyltransferase